jgi:hypothetical protein
LQITSLDHAGHEEITQPRLVHDVAQDFQRLAVTVDFFVGLGVVGRGDNEDCFGDVLLGVLRPYQFGCASCTQGGDCLRGVFRHDHETRTGLKQSVRFAGRYSAAADENDAASGQIEKYWVLCHSDSL